MAAFALLNAFAFVHGHDFTCDSNQLDLTMEVNALDATTFCDDGWTKIAPGVKSSSLSMAGFWQAGADSVDAAGFADLGTSNRVVTFGPDQTDGSTAYMFRAGFFSYNLLGAHGELAPFNLTAAGSDGYGVVRGKVGAAKQTVDATGVLGTAFTLPAAGAADHLYASFHVFGAPGTTITVVLESDADDTFGAATTRATIGPISAAGGVWVPRVAGAITDTHYRFRVTAITGEFTVAAAAAVA
jgi:hypothetical protein